MSLFIVGAFLFGLIIGSFANVFILRYGTGRSINGRSSCASCGKTLSWYELIPVASYVIQRGRCRSCGSAISPQYMLVELVFGVVFALCAWAAYSLPPTAYGIEHIHPYVFLAYLWTLSFFLISLAVYDVKHMIIPNAMVYAAGLLALVFNIGTLVFSGITSLHPYILTVAAGPIVALPLFLLWLVSRGRWMGFGDVKLAIAMGWILGIVGGLSAFVFGVWAATLVSLAVIGITRLVVRRGRLTMKSMIPFGPFLVAATLFVLLSGITFELFLYV